MGDRGGENLSTFDTGEGGESLGTFDTGEEEVLVRDFKVTVEVTEVAINEQNLSVQERIVADRLITMVADYAGGLNFMTKPFAKTIVKRLIEKLGEAELGEDAVGVIGEGVWRKLNTAGKIGNAGEFVTEGSAAERKIVDDIIGRVNGYFSLIEGFWKRIVNAAGPDASGKIIRVVAKEAWPEVRRKLGL